MDRRRLNMMSSLLNVILHFGHRSRLKTTILLLWQFRDQSILYKQRSTYRVLCGWWFRFGFFPRDNVDQKVKLIALADSAGHIVSL